MELNASPGLGLLRHRCLCPQLKAWREFGLLVFVAQIVFVSRSIAMNFAVLFCQSRVPLCRNLFGKGEEGQNRD